MTMLADVARLACELTRNEREALLSLPAQDRGGMPDDLWWAYASLLDQGLATSDRFSIVATPLGEAVRRWIERQ